MAAPLIQLRLGHDPPIEGHWLSGPNPCSVDPCAGCSCHLQLHLLYALAFLSVGKHTSIATGIADCLEFLFLVNCFEDLKWLAHQILRQQWKSEQTPKKKREIKRWFCWAEPVFHIAIPPKTHLCLQRYISDLPLVVYLVVVVFLTLAKTVHGNQRSCWSGSEKWFHLMRISLSCAECSLACHIF